MPPVPFNWIKNNKCVPVYRKIKNEICGFVAAEWFGTKPGNLHMQFACPECGEREDLGVYPVGPDTFLVSTERHYDIDKAVFRSEDSLTTIDHRSTAIKHLYLRNSPHNILKEWTFTFIHHCAECGTPFDTAIYWAEERKGFEISLWKSINPKLNGVEDNRIDDVQMWRFTGQAAKDLELREDWPWAKTRSSRGLQSNWRIADYTVL